MRNFEPFGLLTSNSVFILELCIECEEPVRWPQYIETTDEDEGPYCNDCVDKRIEYLADPMNFTTYHYA